MGQNQFIALILGCGALNALVGPVLRTSHDIGWSAVTSGFSISFVIWLSIAWSLHAIWTAERTPVTQFDRRVGMAVAIGLIIPSATIAWLTTATAAIIWHRRRDNTAIAIRSALAILVFASLRDPISAAALKLLATPFLVGDAAMVSWVLNLFADIGPRHGNIITGPNNHKLLILTGCTSYTNLSLALLGWFAITLAMLGRVGRRQLLAGLFVASSIVALNVLRLTYMGLGPDAYHFAHEGAGTVIFEATITLSTMGFTFWGTRNARTQRTVHFAA